MSFYPSLFNMDQCLDELNQSRLGLEDKFAQLKMSFQNGEFLSLQDFDDVLVQLSNSSLFLNQLKAELQGLRQRTLVNQKRIDLRYKNREGAYVSSKLIFSLSP